MTITYEFLYLAAGSRAYDPETRPQLEALLTHLSNRPRTIAPRTFFAALSKPYSKTLIAIDQETNQIIGTAIINFVYSPLTGCEARLDDVVVHPDWRGRGVGKELCKRLIEFARESGADSVELTSAPHREYAHAMYRSLGFQTRKTNVFELDLAIGK